LGPRDTTGSQVDKHRSLHTKKMPTPTKAETETENDGAREREGG
jgi:hypothetical protein